MGIQKRSGLKLGVGVYISIYYGLTYASNYMGLNPSSQPAVIAEHSKPPMQL